MRTQGGKITVLAEKNVDVDGHGRSGEKQTKVKAVKVCAQKQAALLG